MTKVTLEVPEDFADFCKRMDVHPGDVLNAFMTSLASGNEENEDERLAVEWFNTILWHDQNECHYVIEAQSEEKGGGYLVTLYDGDEEKGKGYFPIGAASKAQSWWDKSSKSNRDFWFQKAQSMHPGAEITVEMAFLEFSREEAYEEAYNFGENWAAS